MSRDKNMQYQKNLKKICYALLFSCAISSLSYASIDSNIAKLQQQATQGDAEAQFELARAYQRQDVERNDLKLQKQAFVWYTKAAQQGHINAQYVLGLMHDLGLGTEVNFQQAMFWYGKAAQQGYANAQVALGRGYQTGEGIEKNAPLGFAWILKAAEQGLEDAQYRVGASYQYGIGQSKNDAVAL